MTITAVNNNTVATETAGKSSLVLDSQDFMNIMITELTNQDPFEPMKNQDLLNQISTIQQLQSSQNMAKSFEKLIGRYDSLLMRQELGTASGMIGELISGNTANGEFALGKVVAVKLDGDNIILELDTGQGINIEDMIRLGGSNSQDIVGEMVIGMTADGQRVVGEVASVEVDNDEVTLHLQLLDKPEGELTAVPLYSASIINESTADLLIGYSVEGVGLDDQTISGIVESVEWTPEGVVLNVLKSDGKDGRLPMGNLTKINSIL